MSKSERKYNDVRKSKSFTLVTLTSDKKARAYVLHHVRAHLKRDVRPFWIIGICMPVCIFVAAALLKYDTARPHSWIFALVAAPAMCLALRWLPYMTLVFPDRWIFDRDGFRRTGSSSGRIRFSDVKSWDTQPIQDFEGYYELCVTTHQEKASIVLSAREYPLPMISTLFPGNLSE